MKFCKSPFLNFRMYERSQNMRIMRIENLRYILHEAPLFNSVSPKAPLMEKRSSWHLLEKFVKNICERVKF